MSDDSNKVETNTTDSDTEKLITFLNNTIKKLSKKQLNKQELISLTEFYIKSKLSENNKQLDNTTGEDWMKYSFLGYYIYEHVLKEQEET